MSEDLQIRLKVEEMIQYAYQQLDAGEKHD